MTVRAIGGLIKHMNLSRSDVTYRAREAGFIARKTFGEDLNAALSTTAHCVVELRAHVTK